MAKMVSLKKSAADRRAEKDALGSRDIPYVPAEDQGVTVNLDHHHLMNLKGSDGEPLAGRMKSGNDVEFHGRGTVERSETRSTPEGERHSATLRLSKGAIEHEPSSDDERTELKGEIAKNYADAEKQSASTTDK